MSLRVVFRRAAQEEFASAAAWYAQRRPGLGEAFATEVGAAIQGAANQPGRCPVVLADVRRTVLRRFPYAVYFRVRGDALVVLAIFHGRRDPTAWRGRR